MSSLRKKKNIGLKPDSIVNPVCYMRLHASEIYLEIGVQRYFNFSKTLNSLLILNILTYIIIIIVIYINLRKRLLYLNKIIQTKYTFVKYSVKKTELHHLKQIN